MTAINNILRQSIAYDGIRKGDPKRVVYGASYCAGQLGETGPPREGDPKGWSTVLVTALGSWGKPVPLDV